MYHVLWDNQAKNHYFSKILVKEKMNQRKDLFAHSFYITKLSRGALRQWIFVIFLYFGTILSLQRYALVLGPVDR